MRASFAELHKRRFGYIDEDAEVIVDALAVEAIGASLAGDGEGNDASAARHGGGVTGTGVIGPSTSHCVMVPSPHTLGRNLSAQR